MNRQFDQLMREATPESLAEAHELLWADERGQLKNPLTFTASEAPEIDLDWDALERIAMRPSLYDRVEEGLRETSESFWAFLVTVAPFATAAICGWAVAEFPKRGWDGRLALTAIVLTAVTLTVLLVMAAVQALGYQRRERLPIAVRVPWMAALVVICLGSASWISRLANPVDYQAVVVPIASNSAVQNAAMATVEVEKMIAPLHTELASVSQRLAEVDRKTQAAAIESEQLRGVSEKLSVHGEQLSGLGEQLREVRSKLDRIKEIDEEVAALEVRVNLFEVDQDMLRENVHHTRNALAELEDLVRPMPHQSEQTGSGWSGGEIRLEVEGLGEALQRAEQVRRLRRNDDPRTAAAIAVLRQELDLDLVDARLNGLARSFNVLSDQIAQLHLKVGAVGERRQELVLAPNPPPE